jgi:hypothetical protein
VSQETLGKSDELSIAKIQLTYRNKNDADGWIFSLKAGARPGYSGGLVVVQAFRDLLAQLWIFCVTKRQKFPYTGCK